MTIAVAAATAAAVMGVVALLMGGRRIREKGLTHVQAAAAAAEAAAPYGNGFEGGANDYQRSFGQIMVVGRITVTVKKLKGFHCKL